MMPTVLLAAAAFWGAATGRPVAALLLAVVVEGVRLVTARWEFGRKEFERVADLVSVALVVLLAWQWFGSRHAGEAIVATFTWLPWILAPLVAMQRLDAVGAVPLTAFFWSMRGARMPTDEDRRIDLAPPFAWVCIVSGACANPRGPWIAAAGVFVVGWLLWSARGAGRRPFVWAATFAVALGVAFALQAGMVRLQATIEAGVMEAIRARLSGRFDGTRTHTAIGELGDLKLSGRVLFRVSGAATPPARLRDGAFDTFAHDTWFASRGGFEVLHPEGNANWPLAAGVPASAWRLSVWLSRGRAVLPLPAGTVRLDDLNVGRVEANPLGTLRVADGPGLAVFTARVAESAGRTVAPGPADLVVPSAIRLALDATIARAGLAGRDARSAAARIGAFFASDYTYTTRLDAGDGERRSLARFLVSDRRGHCEYFASATTLLLRRLGVPARYATGYVVHEWSVLEQAYVVRARDAHAWTLAWIDGDWREIDATPPGWVEEESAAASSFETVGDAFSWFAHRFAAWRDRAVADEEGASPWWLLVILPLAGWVGWGVARRSRRKSSSEVERPVPVDPAMAALIEQLAKTGVERPVGMPLSVWLSSLPWDAEAQPVVVRVARHYRRSRFDPVEPDAAESEVLRADVAWLRGWITRRPPAREAGGARSGPDP